jgi:hypothetical protein
MCVRVPVLAFSKKFQHSTGERPGDGAGSGGGLLDRVVCRAGIDVRGGESLLV